MRHHIAVSAIPSSQAAACFWHVITMLVQFRSCMDVIVIRLQIRSITALNDQPAYIMHDAVASMQTHQHVVSKAKL